MKDTLRTLLLKGGFYRIVPRSIRNGLLLSLPMLYRHAPVSYESQMDGDGIAEICACLDKVKNLRGDIVECGCYRCGTTVLMADYISKQKVSRRIFALDTFEGFNARELRDERLRGLTKAHDDDFVDNSYEYVVRKTKRLGYDNIIVPIKGYFQETLDSLMTNSFCLTLIDCDLSESAAYSANKVFPSLAKGGIMLFDDYLQKGFQGVRKVVDEFVLAHAAQIEEHRLMRRLYYIRKN